MSPTTGAQFSYYSQPVTLVIANGVATQGAPITTVEVATDAAFTSVVLTKTVVPDATGQLALTLDHLMPATTYYWRVKTAAGDNPGILSPAVSFGIGPLLVIQPPAPVQPLANTFPHKRPTFIVTDATRTGPDATLTYRFDVAADAAFSNVVASGTVPEGSGQTSFVPTVDLTSGATYCWRAQASDTTKGVVGAYSTPQAFTTVFPEDGSFRYTLVVRSPSWCLANYRTPDCRKNPWGNLGLSYDGPLVVSGDTLQFTVPKAYYDFTGPLIFKIRRTSNRLAGSISGTTNGPPLTSVIFDGAVFGGTDNKGLFDGTFDGQVSEWALGFPCDGSTICSTSGFAWTLTPH